MLLSWSRAMWGEFVFDLSVHSLLRSLARAAAYFGGCAREWLFDNPKIVVAERHGSAVRFHPKLVDLAGAYCVGLRACDVRKANQKGGVERAIRFLRERFLAAREVRGIEQGNRELLAFLDQVAHPDPVVRRKWLPGRAHHGDILRADLPAGRREGLASRAEDGLPPVPRLRSPRGAHGECGLAT